MRFALTVTAVLASLGLVACSAPDTPDPRVWRAPDLCADGCCNEDYLALPGRLRGSLTPLPDEELRRRLTVLQSNEGSEFRGRWTRRRLRRDLVRELSLGAFLSALDEDAPVALSEPEQVEGVTQHLVRWTDPLVGAIEGVLLLPPSGGPRERPAILGVHGHNEDGSDFASLYGGYALARAGFVVVLPTMRANGEGRCESQTAGTLLRAGTSLAAVRVYEVLRVQRWLAARRDVKADRIGLIGHSGGSSLGNVVVRVSDGFAAYVSDFSSDYGMVEDSPAGPLILDETSPALFPYRQLLRDLSTLPIPALSVAYGATQTPAGYAPVEEFFIEQLVNRVDTTPEAEPEDVE